MKYVQEEDHGAASVVEAPWFAVRKPAIDVVSSQLEGLRLGPLQRVGNGRRRRLFARHRGEFHHLRVVERVGDGVRGRARRGAGAATLLALLAFHCRRPHCHLSVGVFGLVAEECVLDDLNTTRTGTDSEFMAGTNGDKMMGISEWMGGGGGA